jgi:hypothetical protein
MYCCGMHTCGITLAPSLPKLPLRFSLTQQSPINVDVWELPCATPVTPTTPTISPTGLGTNARAHWMWVNVNQPLFPQYLSGTIIRGTLKTPNSQLVTPISTKLQRPDGCD